MPVVDSHHHFWDYGSGRYGWIGPNSILAKDYGPDELKPLLAESGVDAVVSVQADESLAENDFLLAHARNRPEIAGVVGWAPLTEPHAGDVLAEIADPLLKGIRLIVQAQPAEFLLRDDFNTGVAKLKEFGLVYDVLVTEDQLWAVLDFVDRHPEQPFVLDHVAKPKIKEGEIDSWADHVRAVAKRPHVVCKVSGMVTEADFRNWKPADLEPYYDVVLEAFGPERLMFGSDWPVCLRASTYGRWFEVVSEWAAHLSAGERDRLMGGTAVATYRLDVADSPS